MQIESFTHSSLFSSKLRFLHQFLTFFFAEINNNCEFITRNPNEITGICELFADIKCDLMRCHTHKSYSQLSTLFWFLSGKKWERKKVLWLNDLTCDDEIFKGVFCRLFGSSSLFFFVAKNSWLSWLWRTAQKHSRKLVFMNEVFNEIFLYLHVSVMIINNICK